MSKNQKLDLNPPKGAALDINSCGQARTCIYGVQNLEAVAPSGAEWGRTRIYGTQYLRFNSPVAPLLVQSSKLWCGPYKVKLNQILNADKQKGQMKVCINANNSVYLN